jgi:hypothetical protein
MIADTLFDDRSFNVGCSTAADVCRPSALYRGQTLGVSGGVSVMVISPPSKEGVALCGTSRLTPQRPPACGAPLVADGTIHPGERFTDPVSGLEVVCTRAGDGMLSFDGRNLRRRHEPGRLSARSARGEQGDV